MNIDKLIYKAIADVCKTETPETWAEENKQSFAIAKEVANEILNYDEIEKSDIERMRFFVKIICEVHGITLSQFKSKTRTKELAMARAQACAIGHERTILSINKMSAVIHRHRATILFHINHHQGNLDYDKNYRNKWEEVQRKIGNN